MNRETILTLFDYNYWATARILAAMEDLSEAEYTVVVPGVSHGSLRATLVHMLAAETIWRLRCLERHSPGSLLDETDLPTLATLRERWPFEELKMREGLSRLTDEALAEVIPYRTTGGRVMRQPLWQILAHLVNHSTQHRAEAAVILTALGRSPGDVDLILYLRR